MRIAFDAKRALCNFSGLGNYSRTLLNGLASYFPENDYLLFSPKVNETLLAELHGNFSLHLPQTQLHKSIHPLWRSHGLKHQLQKNRVELFHGLSNELPLNARSFQFPKVVTIHDLLYLHHPEDFPFIDRKFYHFKTTNACKYADVITVNSTQTKQDLIRLLSVSEKKITVVHHAIDNRFLLSHSPGLLNAVKLKYDLPAKFILQTGSFIGRKNHLRTLQAFASAKEKTDTHLVFIGAGGNVLKNIKAFVAETKLERRVHIITNVSNEDIPMVYQAASVVVYPSINEGFGLPILEAFAKDVPVITTKGKCFEEVAGDAAVYIDPLSVNELSNAIIDVMQNEKLRNNMIVEGQRRLPLFSSENLASGTMKIYENLV